MKQVYQDLWQSEKGSHFGMHMNAYLLKRKEGNVLFYYTDDISEVDQIKKLGGVDYQYISHHHEFTPPMFDNLTSLNATMVVHQNALKYLKHEVDHLEDVKATTYHSSDILILESPGHTDNNLCFYYKSPYGKSYLFTGDTIYLDRGEWNILVMKHEGGSYDALRKTLLEMRALEVDVVMCSVAIGATNERIEVNEHEWHQIIDQLLLKIRS